MWVDLDTWSTCETVGDEFNYYISIPSIKKTWYIHHLFLVVCPWSCDCFSFRSIRWRNFHQISRWCCTVFDLRVRCCICMVLGTLRVVGAEWNLSPRNPISWAIHQCFCKHAFYIFHWTTLPHYALPHEVWSFLLLRQFCDLDDSFHLFLHAWDQECAHWRNEQSLEGTLVLGKIHTWWCCWSWPSPKIHRCLREICVSTAWMQS